MDIVVPRAAALDIHKKTITACVRTPDGQGGRVEQVRTFSTFLDDLVALRAWLLAEQVTQVAMEATTSYWLPVWRVLEEGEAFERLLLVNARHVKLDLPPLTDVNDASWLCQLLEVGLLAGSFVPPPEIRRLRQVTRYRKRLVQLRTSEIQRVEKTLDDHLQDRLCGLLDVDQVRSGDDRGADRRGTRPAGAGRVGQGPATSQDPRARPRPGQQVRGPPCGPPA